jgi:hypothetical protein
MEMKNRDQRRREKFGHAGGATKEPWPQSEANPVFGQGGTAEDAGETTGDPTAHPGSPDHEGSDRSVDRDGVDSGDSAKG